MHLSKVSVKEESKSQVLSSNHDEEVQSEDEGNILHFEKSGMLLQFSDNFFNSDI